MNVGKFGTKVKNSETQNLLYLASHGGITSLWHFFSKIIAFQAQGRVKMSYINISEIVQIWVLLLRVRLLLLHLLTDQLYSYKSVTSVTMVNVLSWLSGEADGC